jgi:hypothetical protein
VPVFRGGDRGRLRAEGGARRAQRAQITDRILAAIRSAQVVVADFTLQRGRVYFESGSRSGLGIVVSTCRETT